MYSTCLFCNQDLGSNEVIEQFPIGRRLAFDASKGRLWVVCRKCERWNLTPLEERWEAIEECERLFAGTRLRVSTDNIGLAKLREGLELVRIGDALRPEMAAWRYGDQFGRRRRKSMLLTAAGVAAVGGLIVLGPMTGIIAGGPARLFERYAPEPRRYDTRRFPSRIMEDSGHVLSSLPKEVRVALEMASHEEQERRALEGELALLEAAWKEAEEVAQIADDMFLPASTSARLE